MIMRMFKKLDIANKILLPKKVVEQMGREYYMEIYSDKIILIPIKK